MFEHLDDQIRGLEKLIRGIYYEEFIPLHRPIFSGSEKDYLLDCIDSNFVSSVGSKVTDFQNNCAKFTNCKYGVATVNGTAALHTSLLIMNVAPGDEVITQALTFVATANAISYCGAIPVLIDVDKDTLGLSPKYLQRWLEQNAQVIDGQCFNKKNWRKNFSVCPNAHLRNTIKNSTGRQYMSGILYLCSRRRSRVPRKLCWQKTHGYIW